MLIANEVVKQSISITQLALQLKIIGKTLHLRKASFSIENVLQKNLKNSGNTQAHTEERVRLLQQSYYLAYCTTGESQSLS